MDLPSLITELQLRGFDQDKVDTALKCLVHVYAVQHSEEAKGQGLLAEDLVNTYPIEVIQAATELFLEKSKDGAREVFRVKWGCEDTARMMEDGLWETASERWESFVSELDDRYLGFVMPPSDEGARVVDNWKLDRELKWFSVEVPLYGWNVLKLMDDLTSVAWQLDLAFGFRPFSSEGVSGTRVLLHERAYRALREREVSLPADLRRSIRVWRFFSEYDAQTSDIVSLMKQCDLTLEDVVAQVEQFFTMDLTSHYREGQYPPYFINDKKKKEYAAAVRDLLRPVEEWLSDRDRAAVAPVSGQKRSGQAPKLA